MGAGPELKKSLTERQLRMIAIGGVIGAGLFVGSGVVIGDTGPGVFITYSYKLDGDTLLLTQQRNQSGAFTNPFTLKFVRVE